MNKHTKAGLKDKALWSRIVGKSTTANKEVTKKLPKSSTIKMIENIEEILKKSVLWRHEINEGIKFYAYIDNELCQLTINDYPANPLYTLRWGDFSIDFDNRPGGWTFEQL